MEEQQVNPAAPPAAADAAGKIAELEDKYRRALADLANTHKRFQKERDHIGKTAVAVFVRKLLPAIDSMAHSIHAAEAAAAPLAILDGFRLIEAQMLQVLRDSGIHPIESAGKPFDPAVHHAVMTEFTDTVPPGTVTEEMARGFVMGDFVIRPAQVKVAAAPPKPEKPS